MNRPMQYAIIALGVVSAGFLYRHVEAYTGRINAAIGGHLKSTFGDFPYDSALIPLEAVMSGGPGKDGIPALTDPTEVAAEDADYLGPDDLVVGIEISGEARAYPLRILDWHECANVTAGEQAIAVTYCPLCKSALVFDRRIGGKIREFGVSGLLYNSNVLLYDRHEVAAEESLWSQAEMRAVIGPAAREKLELTLLPSELTTWSDWRARHPETRVLSVETGHERPYSISPYEDYFLSSRLMVPVNGIGRRPERLTNKDLLALVYTGEETGRAYAVRDIASAANDEGYVDDQIGERKLRVHYHSGGETIRIEALDDLPPLPVAYMFWFAYSVNHADIPLYEPPGQ